MQPLILTVIGVLVILAGTGGIMLLMYQHLSRSISLLAKQMTEETGNVIGQVEALMGLQTELGFRHALPPTRGWAASPDFLRNIMVHALRHRPDVMVECSSGMSTVVLARCAQLVGRGHVYSLENDAVFAEKTRVLLRENGLDAFATVIDAPLTELRLPNWTGKWYDHQRLPADLRIDLLVIDGPPWFVAPLARYPAVPALFGRLNAGAAIFLDDAAREDETECVKRWKAEHPSLATLDVPLCEKGCVALVHGGR